VGQRNMSQLLEDMERNSATVHGSQEDQQAQEIHFGRYLHRLLGCLVKIRGNKTVEPIHQSLCSFLACLNEESQSANEFASTVSRELRQAFHCPRTLCNMSFSFICIRYLSLDEFRTVDLWSPLQNSNEFEDFEWLALNLAGLDDLSQAPLYSDPDKDETLDVRYPFFAYAAQYWPDHFACCHEEADSSLLEAVIALSTPASALMKNWTTQYSAGIATNPAFWYLRVSWSDLPQIDPLITSSYFGHTSVLRYIASKALKGSPVSQVGSGSTSADDRFLGDQDQAGLIAVRMGHLDCFRELEKISKSIESGNGSESRFETRQYLSTALHSSAEGGQVEVVQYLLQKNVDLGFTMNACTPLGAAVDALHVDVVEKLLARSQLSLQPCGPIFIAARQKWEHLSPEKAHAHRAILDLLVADPRIEWGQRDYNGRTFLSYAAESGFVELFDIFARFRVRNIISSWLNDDGDNAGRTPVWYAAGWGRVEFLKRLSSIGDISRQMYAFGPERENAFCKAARSGFVEVMRFLVSQDVKCRGIDEPDESGRTPLSVAAWGTDQAATQIAAILLATGRVDVDSKSDSGNTPLSFAIGNGNASMVRVLVEAGADMRPLVRRGDDGLLTLIRCSPPLPDQKIAMMAEIEHLWNSRMGKTDESQAVT
jgi:ankyrin repeat protein